MTSDAEDRSTWPRNGQRIRRDELLRLIEGNGGPQGLDLRGAVFVGEGPSEEPPENPIDLSPEALEPLGAAYRDQNGGREAPWMGYLGVKLEDAQLQGAYLFGAQLQGAYLCSAHLQGAHVRFAQLQHADLEHAELQGANLVAANLEGADLSFAEFQGAYLGDARLQRAHLEFAQLEEAQLASTELQGVSMYYVRTLERARWNGALLDHTRIKRETLGAAIGDEIDAHKGQYPDGSKRPARQAYHDAKEAYLLLKNNFNQIGRFEDASWAYVKEQQMEKMAFHWEWREHGWKAWGSFWRWLRNWAYELLTGYGEHPWRPALWAVFVVAVFAAIYAAAGNIAPDFAGDPAQAQGSHNPVDALTHSVAALATIGFNTLEPLGWGARLLTAVESALGIGLFALFIFTIGNRMSRG